MIDTEKDGHLALFRVAFPYIVLCLGYASLVLMGEEFLGDHIYMISGQVGSVFGLAVAFFLGFRMNSAYDRWWEARKIVGELTNNTRSFANKLYTYFSNPNNLNQAVQGQGLAETMVTLELLSAYVLQFDAEIRNQADEGNAENDAFYLRHQLKLTNKLTNELLLAIAGRIETAMARESALEKNDLMQHINRFYEIQGKAERIQNTPFLLIYSAFTRIVVIIYVMLMPLLIGDIDLGGEDSGFEFLSLPIMAVIGSAFLIINRLANLYGAPFSNHNTSIPIQQLCMGLVGNVKEVAAKCKAN